MTPETRPEAEWRDERGHEPIKHWYEAAAPKLVSIGDRMAARIDTLTAAAEAAYAYWTDDRRDEDAHFDAEGCGRPGECFDCPVPWPCPTARLRAVLAGGADNSKETDDG